MKKEPKSRNVQNVQMIDRLSHLPNLVLHHILSFLDTKYMVRTSVLSRRWRCLWKDVPVLRFSRNSFGDNSGFLKHVSKFLSCRFESAMVSSVDINFGDDLWEKNAVELFDSVLKYASSSHGGGNLHHLSTSRTQPTSIGQCYDLVGCIKTYGLHESLRTLELVGQDVNVGSFADFEVLTSLELSECRFSSDGVSIDPFSTVPRLSHLKLVDCGTLDGCSLVVSGSQLLDLEVQVPRNRKVFKVTEVSAPNLESIAFRVGRKYYLKKRLKLNLPSLDHANIQLWWSCLDAILTPNPWETEQKQNRSYMNLLRGLHNAKSLVLCFYQELWKELWEEDQLPLSGMKSIMESEASPFTRLETLRVQYNCPLVPSISYEGIRYFFEGSPNTKKKSVKFEVI